jgi:hypothetical protein
MDNSDIRERIREIWSKLSEDKRRILDSLLHPAAKNALSDAIHKESLPILDPLGEESASLLREIHLMAEAVYLMPDIQLVTGLTDSRLGVVQYLGEALGSIVGCDVFALHEYSKAYGEISDSAHTARIGDAGAYAEAYNLWIDKTALYLQVCRKTVRAVSFNEFTHLWDQPSGLDYLATHQLLRERRGCDSRRVFIYDSRYWKDRMLLKRLFAEVQIQSAAGVSVRVCSMDQLKQAGKGYYYPLLSFGTYDRSAMGVLIPHNINPVVKLIHERNQIRDAITILDDIFDQAETAAHWTKKHASLMNSDVRDFISERLTALKRAVKTRSLDWPL